MFRQFITCTMLLVSSMVHTTFATTGTSLTTALANHQVEMIAIKNAESYHGRGLDLHLKNNTTKPIIINIDPAMIFTASDTADQDLVIVHNEAVVIGANSTQTVTVQCFCAKSYGAPPTENMRYTYKRKGDTIMVQVLRYIIDNHINTDIAQDAVWVLTNNHPLSNVYPTDMASYELVSLMAKLLHRSMPELYVYTTKNDTPTRVAYNPKPLKMMAKFEYIATEDQVLTLGVYNDSGKNVQAVFDNKPFGKGGHRFTVEFEAADVPAGKYYIRLIREGQVMKEQVVSVQ